MAEKSKGQKLNETLSYKKKNYFEESSEKVRKEMFDYAEGYKAFLDAAKTEREGCAEAVRLAKEKGFTRYELGDSLKKGDKKYYVNRDKSVVVFRIGERIPKRTGCALSLRISMLPASTLNKIRCTKTVTCAF